MNEPACPLCPPPLTEPLWSADDCYVIAAAEPDWPGFCRVIWRAHVGEMTDLEPLARARVLEVVFAVEAALREVCAPDKVNLASLGNMVPHLHWHVIPRWRDDATFPGAVWAPAQRPAPAREVDLAVLRAAVVQRLA